MDFIERNLFTKLRAENFNTGEKIEPMTKYKQGKLQQYIDNIDSMPPGKVKLSNDKLNQLFVEIQSGERRNKTPAIQTIYLLRIIVINVNQMLNGGISLRGIIQLGQYLRATDRVFDFVKLDRWLRELHLQRMAQLQGSVLVNFFGFDKSEIPFVKKVEKSSVKLTLKSLRFNFLGEQIKEAEIKQRQGIIAQSTPVVKHSLIRSFKFFRFAPIEVSSNFLHNFTSSLSDLEE